MSGCRLYVCTSSSPWYKKIKGAIPKSLYALDDNNKFVLDDLLKINSL